MPDMLARIMWRMSQSSRPPQAGPLRRALRKRLARLVGIPLSHFQKHLASVVGGCLVCGNPLGKGRRRFCSDACRARKERWVKWWGA